MESKPVRRRHRRESGEDRAEDHSVPGRFGGLLSMFLIVLTGIFIPGGPDQAVHGILYTAAGLVMLLFPPQVKTPWLLYALAALFLALASLSFLPREWVSIPGWRTDLEKMGLPASGVVAPQPVQAAQLLAGAGLTLAVGLVLLGRRAGEKAALGLALAFSLGVAAYTGASMASHHGLWKSPWDPEPTFGLFANRNHTATLLSMGVITSLGVLLQAVRRKRGGLAGFATMAAVVCLWGVLGYSISRAGLLLTGAGVVVWLAAVGRSYLPRGAGFGIAAFAAIVVGLYWWADTASKARMVKTMERASAAGGEDTSGKAEEHRSDLANLDFRIPVQRDTLDMIRAEPWTGSGGGSFEHIFPQYRTRTLAVNSAVCHHPESDWLWAAAEWGVPATLALLAGVCAAFLPAFRGSGNRGDRPLRMACAVAAALVPLHGFMDVPGHRLPLALASLFLLALALPASARGAFENAARPSGWFPRLAGAAVLLAGLMLLRAQWFGGPELAWEKTKRLEAEARDLFVKDYALLHDAGGVGNPWKPESVGTDLLELSLAKMEEAVNLMPLQAGLHYVRGALALEFDDRDELADRSFALDRGLDPIWIGAPLREARSYARADTAKAVELCEEAMRRSRVFEERTGDLKSNHDTRFTYRIILSFARHYLELSTRVLHLAGDEPAKLRTWVTLAHPGALDTGMPWLLERAEIPADLKKEFLTVWWKRSETFAPRLWKEANPPL